MRFSTAGNYLGNYVGNLKLKFGHFGFGDRSAECVFKRAWDHGKVECHSFSSAGASGSERDSICATWPRRKFVANISCLYPLYIRGEAYLAAGQGSSAAAEFQKILDHSGIVWNCWTGALAGLGVARANALQSKTSQGVDADAARVRALAAYKDFLKLWKDADPNIPILKEAKAEYARLE